MAGDTPGKSSGGAPRKEPKPFEPPPWEKERFDELEQERREREEAERVAAEAARAAESASAGPAQPAPAEEAAPGRPPIAAQGTVAAGSDIDAVELATPGAPAPAAPTGEPAAGPQGQEPPVDPAKVEEMLQGLSAEEGDGLGGTASNIALGIGLALLVLGVALSLVSMRLAAGSFATGGPAVLVGSTIVGFMGLALGGVGLYLAVRGFRQRGVM
jgi:hypothetical protein